MYSICITQGDSPCARASQQGALQRKPALKRARKFYTHQKVKHLENCQRSLRTVNNNSVIPPLLEAGAEVVLVPLEQLNVAAGCGGVGEGQGQRGWAVDDHAVGVVL